MFLRQQSVVTYVVWAVLVLAIVVALSVRDWSIAFVGAATLALTMVPAAMADFFHLRIPIGFYAAIVLFLFGTVFLGEAYDFYERFWWWDIVLHGASALGFGIIGVVLALVMFEGEQYAAPPLAIAVIAFGFAVTIGVIWEVFEFAMDQVFGLNMQKSGLMDTMSDLIVNSIGALLGAASGYAFLRGRARRGLSGVIAEFLMRNERFFRHTRSELFPDTDDDPEG